MKKILLLFAVTAALVPQSRAQLLAIDFNKSSNIKDYQHNTPGTAQFSAIGATGPGNIVSVHDGKLRFDRTADADYGYFVRTESFSPLPTIMMVKFDITVSGNDSGTTQNTAAVFQVGDGFAAGINPISKTTQELIANTHSRLGISLGKTEGQFSILNYNLRANSAPLSGTQTVTWIINNTAATVTYTAPDKKSEILGADRSDIWVGNTRIANEQASPGGLDKELKNFKFSFIKGKGIIDLDHILITDISDVAK